VDDDDWALGVMDALLADRAEQEAREPTVPARTDNEEIVRGSSLDEDFRGGPLRYLALDFDAFGFGSDVGDCPFEQVFGRSVAAPVGVAFDAAADVAERPGVDGSHGRVPQPRLGECPTERRLCSGGAVDPDDHDRRFLRLPVLICVLSHVLCSFRMRGISVLRTTRRPSASFKS
jgi:hypothetical protein